MQGPRRLVGEVATSARAALPAPSLGFPPPPHERNRRRGRPDPSGRRGMRISRLTSIVSIAVATALIAGCGGGSSGSSASSDGKVTLNWFMWSGSDVEKNAWLHVADMVTA